MDERTTGTPVSPATVFSPTQLNELVQQIIDSGALGRSRVYGQLLEYLAQAALAGRSPKEVEIALDVLGRGSSFDVSRDSVVRVYVHQLRKRLDTYYAQYNPEAKWRLVVPRGQYTVALLPVPPDATPNATADATPPAQALSPAPARWWLPAIGFLSVAVLVLLFLVLKPSPPPLAPGNAAATHPMWAAILDDDLPVLLVMGDYYIFGERDETGRITRMIRDFNINSQEDLSQRFVEEPELANQFLDLNLHYLPEGSAAALARLVPLLQQNGKDVRVTMMSKLLTPDLRTNHIVYVGYISALDRLRRLTFADSGLEVGRTYDELFNRDTGEIYSSDAGLPRPDQPFRDYGLLSTFPAPAGNQIVIVASTRDAALMHTAQIATDATLLSDIDASRAGADGRVSFEALFEVMGIGRTNFDATLIYAKELKVHQIWSSEPAIQ